MLSAPQQIKPTNLIVTVNCENSLSNSNFEQDWYCFLKTEAKLQETTITRVTNPQKIEVKKQNQNIEITSIAVKKNHLNRQ